MLRLFAAVAILAAVERAGAAEEAAPAVPLGVDKPPPPTLVEAVVRGTVERMVATIEADELEAELAAEALEAAEQAGNSQPRTSPGYSRRRAGEE